MTNRALTEVFGAEFHGAFVEAGMADEGTFTPKGGAAQACTVMVDRDIAAFQRNGIEFIKNTAVVVLLKPGITGRPKAGDVITVDGETFEIERRLEDGESEAEWKLLCRI